MTTKALAMMIMAAAVSTTIAAPAYAGGFLADTFVRPFSPRLASELDKEHAKLGKPLDKAAKAGEIILGRIFLDRISK